MIIKITGNKYKSRWSLEINDKLISLCGCDYLIILSLAVVWINNKDNSLHQDYLFGDNTSRYIYRLKEHISELAGFDAKELIVNQNRYNMKRKGCYRLNVDEVIIEPLAFEFDDNRFKIVLDKL